MEKRRRSPRRAKPGVDGSPPPKRKKLERKGTIEVEPEQEPTPKLDRKTTSFLDSVPELNSLSTSLSGKSNSKLLQHLSSIVNPNLIVEPEPINFVQREGILETLPWPIKSPEGKEHEENFFENIPLDIVLSIFKYLPSNGTKLNLGMTCKRMMTHLCNFVPPCDSNDATNLFCWGFEPLCLSDRNQLARPDILEPLIPDETKKWKDCPRYPLVKEMHVRMNTDYKWGNPYNGFRQISAACQPKGLSLTLYDYQAMGLSWMLSVERIARTRQRIIFSTLVHVPGENLACNYAAGPSRSEFIVPTMEVIEDEQYQGDFTTQGGMFADEMGLGKTISMISLILSNPRQKRNDGTFAPSLVTAGALFESQATLVICPSHLVAQWKQEVTKNTKLVCYSITTAPNHKKIRYKTLVESDIIIVSHEFLVSNSTYVQLADARDRIIEARKAAPKATTRRSRGLANNSKQDPDISHIQPLFHLVGWHRIVLDEAHELLHKGGIKFQEFQSNYRWYVTGTPLPRRESSLLTAMRFLNVTTTNENTSRSFISKLEHRAVHKSLFWRNTKKSVDKQIEIPPVVEETVLVNLLPVERAIYDSLCFVGPNEYNNENTRRHFLLDPNARFNYRIHQVPLSDPNLPKRYHESYTAHCINDRLELNRHKKKLAELMEKHTLSNQDESSKYHAKKSIIRCENAIVAGICKCACFSRLLVGETTTDVCDACGEYAAGRTTLNCKHCVCSKCLQEIINSEKNVCSECNTEVNISLLQVPKLPDDKEIPATNHEGVDNWTHNLRLAHGSKFAETAKYLRDVMEGDNTSVKLIVFSQYDASLWHLASILEDGNEKVFKNRIVRYKGNVHVRKKLLAKFTDTSPDSPRILFISLSNAAGAHLAVATHVLLLDPVVGCVGKAKSTDAQAIARAHRLGQGETVIAVRFIVQNSIDQDDYEKAYGEIVRHEGLGPKSARK